MYFQIQTQLLAMIRSGHLNPGDPLPSEGELSKIYGVSRMTSRQALQSLKMQGLVSRRRGRGSFVSQPQAEEEITHLRGFTSEMEALGLEVSSRVLYARTTPASEELAAKLGIAVDAPVYKIRRLRLSNRIPYAIQESYIPCGRFPGIEKLDFARLSLYRTLTEKYGVRVSHANEVLEARPATPREAQLLEIEPQASLLVITREIWSSDGVPVESSHSIYRGDRYRATLQIQATIE